MQHKSWQLEDAQKVANELPYTFYKSSKQVISQLKIGNLAKLIFEFESDDPNAPRAERMWVEITKIEDNIFSGLLDNKPHYINDLEYQDTVEFLEYHIIDTDLDDPIPSITDQYMKRCFVTNNILYSDEKVGYLYREAPDNDMDSGWRFTTGTESDEYMDNPDNLSIVSLGALLQKDDSCLTLLECEAEVAFIKDENGNFIELDD